MDTNAMADTYVYPNKHLRGTKILSTFLVAQILTKLAFGFLYDDMENEIALGVYTSHGYTHRAEVSMNTWAKRVRHFRAYTMDDKVADVNISNPRAEYPIHRIQGGNCVVKPHHRCLNGIVETLKQLYADFPGKKWYVVGDDDTYVIPRHLLCDLQSYEELNPKKQFYMIGSLAGHGYCGGDSFGVGGAGVVYSRSLVEIFVKYLPECYKLPTKVTYGDEMAGLCIHYAYEMYKIGEAPTLPEDPVGKPGQYARFWCWKSDSNDYSVSSHVAIQGGLCPPSFWAHKAFQYSQDTGYVGAFGNPLTGVYAMQHVKKVKHWKALWKVIECYEYLEQDSCAKSVYVHGNGPERATTVTLGVMSELYAYNPSHLNDNGNKECREVHFIGLPAPRAVKRSRCLLDRFNML